MVDFIDEHRDRFGVEPICKQLPIAPSTYYEAKAREVNPERKPARQQSDELLCVEVQRVWEENFRVYGARKVWRQMNREGIKIAKCTTERLMRRLAIRGVSPGKAHRTTWPDLSADRPTDLVQREFNAERPNQLWVADITYVATWRGVVYVAFIVDVFARMIVGWRVWNSQTTDLFLDELE